MMMSFAVPITKRFLPAGTNQTIYTVPTASVDTTVFSKIQVVGQTLSSGGNVGIWEVIASFKRSGGAASALAGATVTPIHLDDPTNWSLTASLTATTLALRMSHNESVNVRVRIVELHVESYL